MFFDLIKNISLKIPDEYQADFFASRFKQNNFRALLGALFLCIEQFIYGMFISVPGSRLQTIYYYTSVSMLLFIAASLFFILRPPVKIKPLHKLYEASFVFFGLIIALLRFLLADEGAAHLPTIFVVMLYACAVFFMLNFRTAVICYFIIGAAAVGHLPILYPGENTSIFTANIISNSILSLIFFFINYRNFIKAFLFKKEIEEANRSLLNQSNRDSLTDLYNRRKLDEVCRMDYLRAERYNMDFSIILLDIDLFKEVNDNFGHDVGDIVLREIAEILRDNIREVDVCGRWGGEEFLIVCQETDLLHAELLAERLRSKIETHQFNVNRMITASFGVAAMNESEDLKTLFKMSDNRLYLAKSGGRNIVVSDGILS